MYCIHKKHNMYLHIFIFNYLLYIRDYFALKKKDKELHYEI